uniref:Uncharacterized protein n=1 Tax=Vitis vinifera TaxID=29760 RepID=A5B2E8_VITVI|nr:hypothetical protein VITISV_000976 [Vitis vinifera]
MTALSYAELHHAHHNLPLMSIYSTEINKDVPVFQNPLTQHFMLFHFSSSSSRCLILMVVTMAMLVMTLPRMSPTQYYRTVLLSPVHDPKPHDGAQALSGDSMPSLGMMHCYAFVCSAVSMASSSHLSPSVQP